MHNKNKIHYNTSFQFVMISIIITLLTVSQGFAQDSERKEVQLSIEKINLVPSFDSEELDYNNIINIQFENQGTLDAIYNDRIIVGDIEFFLKDRQVISGVNIDDYVGIQLGEQNEVVLIKKIQKRE